MAPKGAEIDIAIFIFIILTDFVTYTCSQQFRVRFPQL